MSGYYVPTVPDEEMLYWLMDAPVQWPSQGVLLKMKLFARRNGGNGSRRRFGGLLLESSLRCSA